MNLKDSLITMIGDFVQLKRNPEFCSKSELYTSDSPSIKSNSNHNRRFSLNINVKNVKFHKKFI